MKVSEIHGFQKDQNEYDMDFLNFYLLGTLLIYKKTAHHPSIKRGWCYTFWYCHTLPWDSIQDRGNNNQKGIHIVHYKQANHTSNSTLQTIMELSFRLHFAQVIASLFLKSAQYHTIPFHPIPSISWSYLPNPQAIEIPPYYTPSRPSQYLWNLETCSCSPSRAAK